MAVETELEEQALPNFVSALPVILWHRRWLVIIPAVLTAIGGIVAAFVIHPVYQSSATILIESQQLPDDLVGTTSSSAAQTTDVIGQRVARARERVLSRMDLIRLIRAYNLYPAEQRVLPMSKIIDKMRADTTIGALSNDIQLSGRGRSLNTIAIQVAFQYDDPRKTQLITQQFVDRFLAADAGTQASQATDAVNFLTEQATALQTKIAEIENRVTQIQTANGTVLALGQSTGDRETDLSRIDSAIAGLQAESGGLASQTPTSTQDGGVAAAQAQLLAAQAKYSDSHPDVLAARAQLEAARRAAAALPPGANPTAARMAANRAQLDSLMRARALLSSRSATVTAAQAQAPAIAAQVTQLQKQADGLREQYLDIGRRLQTAQIQARVEAEQKGERLTLADPPVVPDSPIRPNRPALIAGGIFGGIALGLGLALLVELLLHPIRGIGGLKLASGEAPLAVIPDFDHKPSWFVRMMERRNRRKFARA